MNTTIGLFSKLDTCKNSGDLPKRKITYIDSVLTVDMPSKTQRIITPIDISECTSNPVIIRIDCAVWDTGAVTSCISDKLAREMKIRPVDNGIGVTPSGAIDIVYYMLDIYLSPEIVIKNLKVAGFPLEQHDCDFIIGMDVISKGDFSLINSGGRMKLSFEMKTD